MGEQVVASLFFYGGVAQLGEHLPCKQGVMSSNLTISTQATSSARREMMQTGSLLAGMHQRSGLCGDCRDRDVAKAESRATLRVIKITVAYIRSLKTSYRSKI